MAAARQTGGGRARRRDATNQHSERQAQHGKEKGHEQPARQSAATVRCNRGGRGGPRKVPAAVDTDILVMHATTPLGEAFESIKGASPSYVVVTRDYQGEALNYAFATEEVVEKSDTGAETPLLDALNLHETDRSATRSVTDPMTPSAPTGGPRQPGAPVRSRRA